MVFKKNRKNQTSSSLVKLVSLLGTLGFILTSIWVILQNDIRMASVQFFEPEFFTAEPAETSQYFLVNTEGCRIPMMDPFDPSILSFLLFNQSDPDDTERAIECVPPGLQPHQLPLVKSNLTHIFLDDNSLLEWNLTSTPYCCYEPFWRKNFSDSDVTKMSSSVDGIFEKAGVCTYFQKSAYMGEHEFVKVECYPTGFKNSYKTKTFYKDFFSFAPKKKKKSVSTRNATNLDENDQWSMLILGVDAVSRMNLYRQMPRTLDYIKNNLKAVEMFGFNKVGDNTFPNLVPVLSGLTTEELKNICWPSEYTYFDHCPFIWKEFEQDGYKTLFAEDASWMGIFSYCKSGFLTQPTDYYWKVFNERAENEIGFDKRLNAKLCTGYRTTLQTLLEYGEKVTISLAKEPFFGLLWGASMSHDFLNLPRYGDELHREFLETLDKNGVLDNCVLVFMSDHGIRWGGIRSTHQGYQEERLPFLFFAFPKRFRKKYPTAMAYLRGNTHRLTTPFDLHEMLLDILHSRERLDKAELKQRILSLTKNGPKRGISLFLPIPLNRTCNDAGITTNWCTCSQASEISVKDTDVIHAAFHLIDYINGLLKDQSRQCAKLMLKEIISATVEQSGVTRKKRKITERLGPQDFVITIVAHPGGGNFEATVRKHMNGTFTTLGTVSRTNVYGNQSACISNYRLKLYCYCINYKPTS